METILAYIEQLLADWRVELGPEFDVVLGGSLAAGTFVLEGAKSIDVEVMFLTDGSEKFRSIWDCDFASHLELEHKGTILLSEEWPHDNCIGRMFERTMNAPGIAAPLAIKVCLRNRNYICWESYFQKVLSEEEFAEYTRRTVFLSSWTCLPESQYPKAYLDFKLSMLNEVKRRAIGRGLVLLPKERIHLLAREVFRHERFSAHLIGKDLHVVAPSQSRFRLSIPSGGQKSYYCDCGKPCASVPGDILEAAVRAAIPFGAVRVIMRQPKSAIIGGLPVCDVAEAVWESRTGGSGERVLADGYASYMIETW